MIEMHVQKYLRGGKTLGDLESEYAITGRVCEDLGVVSLNYSQRLSPMGERICQECRGLILEVGTWNVAARSFDRFFNYGQPEAEPIDWTTARIQEKLDGSLMIGYHSRGDWRIATRGVADASGPVNVSNMTFGDLARRSLSDMGWSWGALTKLMDPRHSYAFELTAPENRVVVEYKRRRLTLLGAWDLETGNEIALATLEALAGFPTVTTYDMNVASLDALCQLAGELDPRENEGYVVVDGAFRRVKVKNPLYVSAANLVPGLCTTLQQLEFLLSDHCDDLIPMLPLWLLEDVTQKRELLSEFQTAVVHDYAALALIETKRDFAAEALKRCYSALLFEMHKGKGLDAAMARFPPATVAMTVEKWDRERG